MLITKKHRVIFILISVAAATILMAASLSNLELRPGRVPYVTMESEESESDGISPPNPFLSIFIKFCFLISGIFITLSIVYGLRSPRGRRLIFIFLSMVLFLLSIGHYLRLRGLQLRAPVFEMQGLVGEQTQLPLQGEQSIPNPPWWLVFMVSLGLSALILGASLFLWRRLRRRTDSLDLVAGEARKTLRELRAGVDLEEGVIRCYFEMNQVLSEQRGLKRQQAMTTREFEKCLEEVGLPGLHIRRLTRLFEKVRYGAKNLDELENREAISCLTTIVKACEGSK